MLNPAMRLAIEIRGDTTVTSFEPLDGGFWYCNTRWVKSKMLDSSEPVTTGEMMSMMREAAPEQTQRLIRNLERELARRQPDR